MRALAMTGIVTAFLIDRIISGSDMRATPPEARISDWQGEKGSRVKGPPFSAMRTHRDSLKGHHSDGAALLRNDGLLDVSDVCA